MEKSKYSSRKMRRLEQRWLEKELRRVIEYWIAYWEMSIPAIVGIIKVFGYVNMRVWYEGLVFLSLTWIKIFHKRVRAPFIYSFNKNIGLIEEIKYFWPETRSETHWSGYPSRLPCPFRSLDKAPGPSGSALGNQYASEIILPVITALIEYYYIIYLNPAARLRPVPGVLFGELAFFAVS